MKHPVVYIENFLDWCWNKGMNIGFLLIVLPHLKDLIMHGAREWNIVNVGTLGAISQGIGLVIIVCGTCRRWYLDEITKKR